MPSEPTKRSLKDNITDGKSFNPGINTLNSSGDVSSCEFIDWFLHTQSMGGMWKRFWVFTQGPTIAANAVPSGCPVITYTACDVNWWAATDDRVQRASYCSGAASAMDIDYASDETYGGFGVSGTFWTQVAGTMRRRALTTDPKDNVDTAEGNVIVSKVPGEYMYGQAYDSSSSFATQFHKITQAAAHNLPYFDPTLVTI